MTDTPSLDAAARALVDARVTDILSAALRGPPGRDGIDGERGKDGEPGRDGRDVAPFPSWRDDGHFRAGFAAFDAARQALAARCRALRPASPRRVDIGPSIYNPVPWDDNANSYSGVLPFVEIDGYLHIPYSRSTGSMWRRSLNRFEAIPPIPSPVAAGVNGGCRLPGSGRAIFTPYQDARLWAFNARTWQMEQLESGLAGPHKWSGCAVGAGGQAAFAPHRARALAVYNEAAPAGQRFRHVTIPSLADYAFGGAPVPLPDGKLLCVPHCDPRGLIFDPLTDQWSWTAPICATSEGLWGGALVSATKVLLYNHKHDRPVIFDFMSGAVAPFPVAVGTMGVANFNGGFALADGRHVMVPFQSPDAAILDPEAGTVLRVPGFGPAGGQAGGFAKGGCLDAAGNAIFATFNGGATSMVTTGQGLTLDPEMVDSPHVGGRT
jgi:hypothetical protein